MTARADPSSTTPRRLQILAACLLLVFCLVVATITFWPGPPDPDGQRALRAFLKQAHLQGLPLWITFGKVEFGANILMFVPIGFFGALALPRLRWFIIPAAVLASAGIEVLQSARLPDRVGTPRDVVANGIGAVVGYLLAAGVLLALHRRRRRRAPMTAAPIVHQV